MLVIRQIDVTELEGSWPRHFLITEDGEHLVVASQTESKMEVFKIDQSTGMLNRKAMVDTEAQSAVVAVI